MLQYTMSIISMNTSMLQRNFRVVQHHWCCSQFPARSLFAKPSGLLDLQIFSSASKMCGNRIPTSICSLSDDNGGGPSAPFRLIIYSKDNCPLCIGLKEKVEALIERAAFVPSILSKADLEVRDIADNPAWQAAFEMQVPVMAQADIDGANERALPRASPRVTAEGLAKHLAKYLL